MEFKITNINEVSRLLEYFNFFHDGFIKVIQIISQDEFNGDKSQSCTGVFDIVIDFAHYNYNYDPNKPDYPPYNQIIRAHFKNAKDIIIDLHKIGTIDWNISKISIEQFKRKNRKCKGYYDEKDCLVFVLGRDSYEENEWKSRKDKLFTFTEALFEEL